MSWIIKYFRCVSPRVHHDDSDAVSHSITESNKSNTESCGSFDNKDVIDSKLEPSCEQHVPQRHLIRTQGSLGSMNSICFIQNDVVVSSSVLDYMDTLPPPQFVYLKDDKCCKVYTNKYGNRYIKINGNKRYLQDIRGSYRYGSLLHV
jgi:hypothetical protein